MKLIVIVVIVLVLLAGGGGAAYYFRADLFGDSASRPPITKTTDTLFVDLESMTIAVIRNRRIAKHVVLQVTLEVPDEETRASVSHALPRIKDAFIKDLYDYYAVQQQGRDGINVEAIKKRLKRTADEVMGPGKVNAVLIQGAVERQAEGS